jgi:glyoxylase-like metal-dependent hydrolase (beta-lactamase superfamily II)
MTVKQADALVDWVVASGKNLTTIYITHCHGDHFFGIGALLDRFPNARAVTTPDVMRLMRQQASPEFLESFWKAGFPGQILDRPVIADELKGNVIDLEGRDLVAVELGHTDTDHTTCLNVPSVGRGRLRRRLQRRSSLPRRVKCADPPGVDLRFG